MVSLLPPFIDPQRPLVTQLSLLVSIILCTEFTCMMLYASGGKSLRQFLSHAGHLRLMNRLAGTLMAGVGVWLALG